MWFWISFVLLGMIVYLPIGCVIWIFIASLSASLSKKSYVLAEEYLPTFSAILLFIAAVLVHGGLFGWYDKIEKPDEILVSVDNEVNNDFYQYEEKDGKIYITVSDKNFSEFTKSHLTDNGDIHFNVRNKNAKKERANLKWTMEIGGEQYERNTLPAGTELHIFSASFSLKTGENTIKVTAKNDLGEISKTIVVNKLSTEAECAKSENAELSLCQKIIAANLSDSAKQAQKDTASQSKEKSSSTYNFETDTLSGSASVTKCSYEKYGECWDEVIEQAESDAWGDAYLYGNDYKMYPHYRGCEGYCADIYDDAYWDARDYAGN